MSVLTFAIPLVVKLAERLIKGKGKGADKKSLALEILKPILESQKGDGVGLPGKEELGKIVDSIVESLNENKVLIGEQTIVAEGVTDAWLVAMGLQNVQNGIAMMKRGGIG